MKSPVFLDFNNLISWKSEEVDVDTGNKNFADSVHINSLPTASKCS